LGNKQLCEKIVLKYENGKLRPAEIIPGTGAGKMHGRGGEFNSCKCDNNMMT
jgi:hypothetical protein